ncbi:MAG: aldo/keto reductase [Bacteroidales bacterium]|nr:aldo/keto reductase [Bacteroidales bacterium]
MNYLNLGNSDLKISKIAFGAWAIGGWMWGGSDEKDALLAIDKAIDLGITSIDTAAIYGFGHSEELIGKAIKGKREKIQIFTKYGLIWDDNKGEYYFTSQKNDGTPIKIYKYAPKKSVINECEQSLKRLCTDYIDLYQIHWPDNTTPVEETMEAMEILKKQGKIKAAGVSNYSKNRISEARKYFNIISNQVPYSMVNREIENELIPYCIEKNIGILAYSPLQRGILTGKIKDNYKFNKGDNRSDNPYFKKPNLQRINNFLEKLKPIAKKYNASLTQLVINWTCQRPGITCVLVGARNPKQVEENAKSLEFMLSNEDINLINKELDKVIINK